MDLMTAVSILRRSGSLVLSGANARRSLALEIRSDARKAGLPVTFARQGHAYVLQVVPDGDIY